MPPPALWWAAGRRRSGYAWVVSGQAVSGQGKRSVEDVLGLHSWSGQLQQRSHRRWQRPEEALVWAASTGDEGREVGDEGAEG